jgi:PAS domain S-box-containing protein
VSEASDPGLPFRQRLTVRLTGAVILGLLLIGLPFLLAFHRLLRHQQLEALAEASGDLSRVVIEGLRRSMLAGEPHLFDEVLQDLAAGEGIERVILLNHEGLVRVSSDPQFDGKVMIRDQDDTCVVCHREDGAPPTSWTTEARTGDEHVFRTMSAIRNETRCHTCHDAEAATNGILLMDFAMGAADRRFFADIGSTVALGAVMGVLTVAVLVLLLRRMVHRPLNQVVTASQRIVEGDLDARARVVGSGEFSQLASRVNRMTDHLARSIRTVETEHRKLQAILDAVDDEIVVLDRGRCVVAANQAFRGGLDQRDAEIEGQPCAEVSGSRWPCAEDQPDGCPVRRVFDTGELNKGIVSRSDAAGHEHVMEIHASPLRGPDGEVIQAVEVRRDISERRQMEAILAHSEHLASLGLLASGLSHEINNPLGAISTSVAGLRRRLSKEPGIPARVVGELEPVLLRVAKEVERGRSITNRLLRVSRPPGSTRSLVDVNYVVGDTLALLSHDLERSGIRTRLDLSQALPPLLGDESRLGQMLMNVTLNAIQSMAEGGGELRITTVEVDGTIRITIEDTGCGIPPQLLKRIYEPFFTTKPVGKGTGLGLFITHQLVNQMAGTIEAYSRPGQGTRFVLSLPRKERTNQP